MTGCRYRTGQRAATLAWLVSTLPGTAQQGTQPGVEVLPFGADRNILMVFEPGTHRQVDAVSVDTDFRSSGPLPTMTELRFRCSRSRLVTAGDGVPEGIGTARLHSPCPDPGFRGSVYLYRDSELSGELNNIRVQFMVQDGFILYLDGVEWISKNMPVNASSAFGVQSAGLGVEDKFLR